MSLRLWDRLGYCSTCKVGRHCQCVIPVFFVSFVFCAGCATVFIEICLNKTCNPVFLRVCRRNCFFNENTTKDQNWMLKSDVGCPTSGNMNKHAYSQIKATVEGLIHKICYSILKLLVEFCAGNTAIWIHLVITVSKTTVPLLPKCKGMW